MGQPPFCGLNSESMVKLGVAAAAPVLPVVRSSSASRGLSGIPCTVFAQEGEMRYAVYVAAVPLRAPGPAQMLVSTCYSLPLWELQHFLVIVKQDGRSSPEMQASVFDFQPCNPESISVAIGAVSRRKIPGVILKRSLNRIPKNRCWFVGSCNSDGLDAADKFNQCWDTDLIVGAHDCRHYTNGLVEELTGKKNILEDLRNGL